MGKLLDLDGLLAKASENKEEKSRNQEIKKSRNLDLSQKTISGTKRTIIIDDDIWFKVGEEHFQTKKSIQTIVNVALTEYFTKD